MFFDLDKKSFHRNGYTFNHMIKTDGVGCSILLVKTDKNGNPIKAHSKQEAKKLKENNKVKYIHEVEITESMKNKQLVTGDPGKDDLISCMKENDKNNIKKTSYKKSNKDKPKKCYLTYIHFKYNQARRSKDTKKKKYEKIRKELSEQKINEKTVKEIEAELIEYNSKTCNFGSFKEYLLKKIQVNRLLYEHYNQTIYRKLKFNTYINTQRSESNMINDFKNTMGSPEDTLVIIGDYSDNGFKGKAPAISKRTVKIFQNHGYETYLIDEYNTSKKSSCCGDIMENFVARKNGYLVWKLVRCTFYYVNQSIIGTIMQQKI